MIPGKNQFGFTGGDVSSPVHSVAKPILKQLEQLLEEENAALQGNGQVNHSYFIERKNQLLRELMVLQRTTPLPRDLFRRFEDLKTLITRNQQLLETNIRAVKEVADILKSAVLAEDADGTYSLDERRREASP
jgi:flagellar biosynthesis/type III secretory pathway chaperone